MARIVKEPEIRHEELIDISEKLFLKNGYEQTAVSEIVKEANVAQGTFYYYFKSKDDVLNAIIERYNEEMKDILKQAIEDKKMNAWEKFFCLTSNFKKFESDHEGLLDYIHEEKNEILHHRLEKKNIPILTQGYEKIIQQGMEEGFFHTKYPKEAALAILLTSIAISHQAENQEASKEAMKRQFMATIDIIERILGVEEGTFLRVYSSMEVKNEE